MSNNIGIKTTFWQLLSQTSISIPTLQRDYIYGTGTAKTERVLGAMLATFRTALTSQSPVTLDFVYGSQSLARQFMPLDGQQRLTTLFLLHYYAALTSGAATTAEWGTLGRFSYATRNTTIAFCKNILLGKREAVATVIGGNEPISESIKDMSEFRDAFSYDPSVMSMLVVLDRIDETFRDVPGLWAMLTVPSCPITFYVLDFGAFGLSDDLYSKMNSRGKPLTDFEIFKATLHKHLLALDTRLADRVSVKLDTTWMQYVWDILGHTDNLRAIDPAYAAVLKAVFRMIDCACGLCKTKYAELDDDCLRAVGDMRRARALEGVLDTFAASTASLPTTIKAIYDECVKSVTENKATNIGLLRLYTIFMGLRSGLNANPTEFELRYRHVRNLLASNADQVRDDHMTGLLFDIRRVMSGRLATTKPRVLKNSWDEETEKDAHRQEWNALFVYEDLPEINGTLHAFCHGLPGGRLDLGNAALLQALTARLEKARHFFTAQLDEHERRSALLALGDYSMCMRNWPENRYLGIIQTSWTNFTGYHRYDDRGRIMEVIDRIDTSRDITEYVGDTSRVTAEKWRYYAVKYSALLAVARSSPDYGYLYFGKGGNPSHLDAMVLQSSYFGPTYVAWKMMNRILYMRCHNKYSLYLDPHGAAALLLTRISPDASLDMCGDGWHITGIPATVLSIAMVGYDDLTEAEGCLRLTHTPGADYVEEGEVFLSRLVALLPALWA